MPDEGHRYTFAAPEIVFDAEGRRLADCPFCGTWRGLYVELAAHIREDCR